MGDEVQVARIEEVIEPVLRDHGLELVELDWRSSGRRGLLRVFVDKPGGVGIGDCERVSREMGDVLDVANLIPGGYDLEVSSPGLDRLLRTDREFRWAVGKRIRCWGAGGAETSGRLADVDAERVVIERDGERVEMPRAQITKARLDADVPWARRN